MLFALKRTATDISGGYSQNREYITTIVGILTGTITTPNDLNPAVWDIANCVFSAGSYGSQNWTQVYMGGSATYGYYGLTRPSLYTNKACNLVLSWYSTPSSSFLSAHTLTAPGADLTEGAVYTVNANTANQTFYIRLTPTCVHLFSTGYSFVGATATQYNSFLFVDLNTQSYDQVSDETALKVVDLTYTRVHIAKVYQSKQDAYLIPCKRTITLTQTIGASKAEDLTTVSHMLVPITVSYWTNGWLGGNISAVSDLYTTTNGLLSTGQLTNINGYDYVAYVMGSTPASAPLFLGRI